MRPVRVKQRDVTDCGAACLASIAAAHQLQLPVARIRQLASTDTQGSNVLGLVEAANRLNFDAKGVRGPFESLFKIPKPAIAHVIIKKSLHHFVVIYAISRRDVVVMDPGDGRIHRYKHEEFRELWTGVLILVWPSHNFQRGKDRVSLTTRLFSLVIPHRGVMTQAVLGAMVYTVIGLSTSIYVQKIVDFVIPDTNRNLLNLMGVVMLILLGQQIFIGAVKSIFTLRTGQMIDSQLILGYYKHLLRLPQRFFDTMRVGEIISRINDAVKIRAFINDVAIGLVVNIFIVIFSFALMFAYYWKLALVLAAVVPLYALLYWITNRLNKQVERGLMENSAELEAQVVESLNAIGTIKNFGLEQYTSLKTEVRFVTLLKSVYASGLNSILTGSGSELISRSFTIILLWAGAGFVLEQAVTPGELLSFYALVGYFTGPVTALIGTNKASRSAAIAADRLFEIMDLERERLDNNITLTRDMVGDIIFKNVRFRYGSRVTVFQGLNLVIPVNKVTALVGESGSGKSTLISVLQNLYPIHDGSISIGDYDLKYVENSSLRKVIAVVPQRIDLFRGTVTENIALGEYDPDMKKVIAICKELGMTDFIEKLPEGYNTLVGERGATLSGGQCQRLAIARALYRDPQILILDEATSSLDSHSEQFIRRMIERLRDEGKTIILIAHRLSSVCRADKIVVLDNGLMVEEGSHEDLLERKGPYFHLWHQQLGPEFRTPGYE